ncbi:DDE-type integrase/transposase/recombinase [Clostridium sp. DJ247]|uniref:DDE-type integrase/transposase/recombinase n=1 Tax=Clostridium sp. DJ247 TaxID=2726188 RepID=UPI001624542D|nr:DDE-type integrase/transposase/recombinase [Clostridium sp. DJ247]MBC2580735.1 transposase family protein [Clostridium sp. DJ247]
MPYITGTLVYQKLVEEGYVKANKTSLATVLRYMRENNLKRNQLAPVDRRAYEMEFANDCWQSDTSHGPIIKINGQKKKTFLITFIDDASRLILHGEFFFYDNAVNMQIVFKKAISKYGIPKRIFVDNGGTYKNDQLRLICASLGITLIHTKAYNPESKSKIERSFRTIKDNWMNGINWNDYASLEALNMDFSKYLNEKYSNYIHYLEQFTALFVYLKSSKHKAL